MNDSQPIRILVVDSDADTFHKTKDLLSEAFDRPYVTDHIATYDDALAAIKANSHDIYLVDLRLDSFGKNGIDLIKESVSLGITAPYVLMTASVDEIPPEDAFDNGVMDIVDKTKLSPQDFKKTLQFCLKHARSINEAQQRNAELTSLVRDRTRELHKRVEELKLARIEALAALESEKDLNDLRARLLLMVMHEFRTPFATILSSADLIASYTKTEDQASRVKHVERIKKSIYNLTLIVDDFVLVDNTDHDTSGNQNEFFDVAELTAQLISEVRSSTHTTLSIDCIHAAAERKVNLDPRLLGTVLRHLLLNAIKFTLKDQPIRITTSVEGNSLQISVSDSGIGIPLAEQKFIFERFFRASNALNIPGTGIGLNLISAYVHKMNGAITFTSDEVNGTTFTVEIPDCVSTVG